MWPLKNLARLFEQPKEVVKNFESRKDGPEMSPKLSSVIFLAQGDQNSAKTVGTGTLWKIFWKIFGDSILKKNVKNNGDFKILYFIYSK